MSTVYCAYDTDGNLLYVGCTGSITARMRQHEGRAPWWNEHAYVTVEDHATTKAAFAAEAAAIRGEHPRYNQRGGRRVADHPSRPLCNNIRAEMARRWMTQAHLAAAIGMSQVSLCERLTGRTPIDVNELGAIAAAFGMSPAALVRTDHDHRGTS